MNILGIESSCDDTSAAVLKGERVASNIISSHLAHREFGGVVPEVASREHERLIVSVVQQALEEANINKSDLDMIAATAGPGLIGAVLVGLNFAEALAFALQKPFVPINHIEAHIFSTFIEEPYPNFPFLSLTVSGGHTLLAIVQEDLSYKVIGRTIDDAAGEAYDKTGKMLGLSYPAGPLIDKLAKDGDPTFHQFPKALTKGYDENFDFSFSGLKTSVQTYLSNQTDAFIQTHLSDICASIQEAITSVLVMKTMQAARKYGMKTLSVAGGVSANSELRRKFEQACADKEIALHIPKPIYSTDNAAMIASLAKLKAERGELPKERRYNYPAFAAFQG
ncbi:MAG: tRNA (adenosine(37)-N6)-threonylcarbamoyltransferase complex transferase subunit TsaD [Chloroherpetonaceae bacterium]